MTDETQFSEASVANRAAEPEVSNLQGVKARAIEASFPSEPFACPNCAQMLGADVRVCVACHQPIDPARIQALPQPVFSQPTFVPKAQPLVRFPWGVFLAFLLLGCVVMLEGAVALGPQKAMLLIAGIQVVSSIWVFYDARQKGVPKPFYWCVGSLFFWLPIFSWYLVRRRQLGAACPLIEASPWMFLRTLAVILAVTLVLTILLNLLLGNGQFQMRKAAPTTTSDHRGSIALNIR